MPCPQSVPYAGARIEVYRSVNLNKMKTAACYIRVSTEDQTEYSPDAQLKRIKEYAAAHDMLLLPEYTYTELGVSGRKAEKRPQFQALIATARKKPRPFDVVLIHAFDRFARSVKDSRIYKELLRNDLGIELISITEDYGEGKNSFLMEGIKDVLNEYYSLNLSDEVLKGMTEKATRGEIQTIPSFGYKVVDRKFIPDEKEAPIVREIFRRYVAGDGCLGISRWLNSQGIKTHRGNAFQNRTIDYIISNPVYIGKLRWTPGGRKRYESETSDSIVAEAAHAPIIDLSTWQTAQKRRLETKTKFRYKARPPQEYRDWISGLFRCSACGCSLIYCTDKVAKEPRMNCGAYLKGACAVSQRTPASKLKELLISRLHNDMFAPELEHVCIRKAREDSAAVSQDEVSVIREKLERAKQAYLAGVDTVEEYGANKRILTSELERAEAAAAKIPKVRDTRAADLRELRRRIGISIQVLTDDSASKRKKIQAIRSIVSKVIYDRESQSLQVYYDIII